LLTCVPYSSHRLAPYELLRLHSTADSAGLLQRRWVDGYRRRVDAYGTGKNRVGSFHYQGGRPVKCSFSGEALRKSLSPLGPPKGESICYFPQLLLSDNFSQ
jgi:hypothetical protein